MWRRLPIVAVATGLAGGVTVFATASLSLNVVLALILYLLVWTAVSAGASSAVWRYVGAAADLERVGGSRYYPVYEFQAEGRTVTLRHEVHRTRRSGSRKALAGTKTTVVAPVDGVEEPMRVDVEDHGIFERFARGESDYRTGEEAFDDRFEVSCIETGRARAVLTPELRATLLALPGSPKVVLGHRRALIRYDFAGWVGIADPGIVVQCANAATTAAAAVERGCGPAIGGRE